MLLCLAIVGLVYGLTETQDEGFLSPGVLGALLLAVIAAAWFIWWERRARQPLMNIGLLRRTPNYLGSTLSQALAGMAEMGLGLLFPLLLILNLGMNPALAGLALMPTTLPIVLLSRVAGNWYDKAEGPPPAGRRIRDPRGFGPGLVGRGVTAQLRRAPALRHGTGPRLRSASIPSTRRSRETSPGCRPPPSRPEAL